MEIKDTFTLSLLNICLQERIDKLAAIELNPDLELSPNQRKEYLRALEVVEQATKEIDLNLKN